MAIALKLRPIEFAVLFLAIAVVLTAEMLNTAIEKLCDYSHKEYSGHIRLIKDISAGAVLVGAIFTVCVGFMLFWKPALWQLVLRIVTTPFYLIVSLCILAAAVLFIFWGPSFRMKRRRSKEP